MKSSGCGCNGEKTEAAPSTSEEQKDAEKAAEPKVEEKK